jgi:type II secretory pathway pseudopilin PulG
MKTMADYVQFLPTNKELNARAIHDAAQSSSSRGFALLEVLIAASLAGFGMLAIAQLLVSSAASISLARSREASVLAARNKLEYLCGVYLEDSAHPDLAPGKHGPEDVSFLDPDDGSILDRLRLTWSVEQVPDPRPEWKTTAVRLTVTAAPIRNDGSLMDRPYSGRPVVLPAFLGPRIR